jgi:hypothetical protein
VKGEWYCPTCRSFVSGGAVTPAEVHELCNTPVIWIENVQGKEKLYNAALEMYVALKVALEDLEDWVDGSHQYQDSAGNWVSSSCGGCHTCKVTIPLIKKALAKAEGRE